MEMKALQTKNKQNIRSNKNEKDTQKFHENSNKITNKM